MKYEKWKIGEPKQQDVDLLRSAGYPYLLSTVLASRGVTTPEAAAEGIALEICPTSNIQCRTQPSYAEHPAKKLFDAGVRVTISTDNMTLAATDLDGEYTHCVEEMGFSEKDLVQMNIYAAEAAFLPEEERQALAEALRKYL